MMGSKRSELQHFKEVAEKALKRKKELGKQKRRLDRRRSTVKMGRHETDNNSETGSLKDSHEKHRTKIVPLNEVIR